MRPLLVALTLLLLVPANADAKVIDDTSRGYKLSVNSQTLDVTLTVPAQDERQFQAQVAPRLPHP